MIESDVFSTAHVMTTCGDGQTAEYLPFGFRTAGIRIYNSCGPRLFYDLQACAATTTDDFLACGSATVFEGINTLGLSLRTTSTSTTGGAVARPLVGVSAWASA